MAMRLHRFYIENNISDKGEIKVVSQAFLNQVKRVFRLGSGDKLVLFNGSGFDYVCEITDYDKDSVYLRLIEKKENQGKPKTKVILFSSIVKRDKFEWIAEKTTELGVSQIIPVISRRSEKKDLNEDRLKKIIIEASEQSGRDEIPELHEVISLEQALELLGEMKNNSSNNRKEIITIAFHPEGDDDFEKLSSDKTYAIFIGPEGGWADEEISLFHRNNISVKTLGSQILKAETAAIAAVSKLIL